MNSPAIRTLPDLDYLTRDYRGILAQLVQLVERSGTNWTERSAADVGTGVLEILAYMLDHLAYAGDRVASEAFLRTARNRQSVRMHAALGDYRLDRGATSSGYQHFSISSGSRKLPAHFPVGPPLGQEQGEEERDVFETIEDVQLVAHHNRFFLRTSIAPGAKTLWLGRTQHQSLDLWKEGLRPQMALALVSRDRSEIVRISQVQGQAVILEHPCQHLFLAGQSDKAASVLGNIVSIRRGQQTQWTVLGRGGATREDLTAAEYFKHRLASIRGLTDLVESHRFQWTKMSDLAAAWARAHRNTDLAVCRLRTISSPALVPPISDRVDELLSEAASNLRSILDSLGIATPPHLRASKYVPVPGQRFFLPRESPPLWLDQHQTLEVKTLLGGQSWTWLEVEDFLRSGKEDRHYIVETYDERTVSIRLGDGVFGKVGTPGTAVMARWVSGDPSRRNVGRGALSRSLKNTNDWAPTTSNPITTTSFRAPEALDRVADRLRRNLATPATPVTRGDYISLFEMHPEVIEAAVLPLTGNTIRIVVRLLDQVDIGATLNRLKKWCQSIKLAGTQLEVHHARTHYISAAAAIKVHREADPQTVRTDCAIAVQNLLNNSGQRRIGTAVTKGELLRTLESVNGVIWSELSRFDRSGEQPTEIQDTVAPPADSTLACLNRPGVEATGTIHISVVRTYNLKLELQYADRDLVPKVSELHRAVLTELSGSRSRPVREAWDIMTTQGLQELLNTPPFTSKGYALKLRVLSVDDHSVAHLLLKPGDIPSLVGLQIIPRLVKEVVV